jgi:hypothetical protein
MSLCRVCGVRGRCVTHGICPVCRQSLKLVKVESVANLDKRCGSKKIKSGG